MYSFAMLNPTLIMAEKFATLQLFKKNNLALSTTTFDHHFVMRKFKIPGINYHFSFVRRLRRTSSHSQPKGKEITVPIFGFADRFDDSRSYHYV